MSRTKFVITVCAISFLLLFSIAIVQAQVQSGAWSEPYRLSTADGKASQGYCVADEFGFAHCLWTETLFDDQRTVIQYARFDGETWTTPNDIYLAGSGITNVSPSVDQSGILHIAWAEGLNGPAYYTHAPAYDAVSTRNWAQPIQIDIAARTLHLRTDSDGTLHILYTNQVEEPGVYYVRSVDQGFTWSDPLWLDTDILVNHIPGSLSFEVDETGGLHAVWFYGALDQDSRPDWVRYAHSLDGGNTWSAPFTLDQYDEEREHYLTVPGPIMTVSGRTVHVIWAAGPLPYRYHRFSTDAGQTWSPARRIFGDLHGQAGDGFAIDGAGRVHFFGQIRYPVAIYHSYLDSDQWLSPSLIYLIAQEGSEGGFGDRIHAHGLSPVVRAGNQLVLTFADGPADPQRRLFAMSRTLDDVLPDETRATPLPAPVATPFAAPNVIHEPQLQAPTATVQLFDATHQPPDSIPAANHPLRTALLPTILLVGGVVVIRLFSNTVKASLLRLFGK